MYAKDTRELVSLRISICRDSIKEYLQDSREKSLALTKLDECEMWAEKCELADNSAS